MDKIYSLDAPDRLRFSRAARKNLILKNMPDVAELLKKVRRIEIVANRAVNDLFAGQYKSVFRGRGMEFNEVREYQPGDDVRSIDWNVTARAGKPFIKRFIEERELTILFLVDVSASGVFGKSRSKLETAIEVVAPLMFSALKNNDKVGLVTFADRVIDYYRPGKGKANVLHLIRRLLAVQPIARPTDLKSALDYVNRVQKRRAVVFLLSDFLVSGLLGSVDDDLPPLSAAKPHNEARDLLRQSAGRIETTLLLHAIGQVGRRRGLTGQEQALSICAHRHDLIAMTLSDPREREFPDVGLITLQDAETGELLELDTSDPVVRGQLGRLFQVGQDRIAAALRRARIDQLHIGTDGDFLAELRRFFRAREMRH